MSSEEAAVRWQSIARRYSHIQSWTHGQRRQRHGCRVAGRKQSGRAKNIAEDAVAPNMRTILNAAAGTISISHSEDSEDEEELVGDSKTS
jgi:hypothetical protein